MEKLTIEHVHSCTTNEFGYQVSNKNNNDSRKIIEIMEKIIEILLLTGKITPAGPAISALFSSKNWKKEELIATLQTCFSLDEMLIWGGYCFSATALKG